ELCDNPGALLDLYHQPPPLDPFHATELMLMHYSPSLHLTGVLPTAPDKARPQPRGEPSRVQITLGIFGLSDFTLDGWSGEARGTLSLTPQTGATRIALAFRSAESAFRGLCRSLTIEAVRLRPGTAEPVRGPRLFSYPNVWNSCLLLARSKGFS